MNEKMVIYKIKNLDKLIIRNTFCDSITELSNGKIPTPTQMQIMKYILKSKDKSVYQKDLEDVLNLRRATVSGVLQTMEKNGLIDRVISDNDARSKTIILNENTKKLFAKNEKRIKELESIITNNINNSELIIFLKVLDKMSENIKNKDIIKENNK